MSQLKKCIKCGEEKPLHKFHRRPIKTNPKALRSDCKDCHNAATLIRYHTSPGAKEAHRHSSRKFAVTKVYGLTLPEYKALEEKADGRCHVCNSLPPPRQHHFIDHDHGTGKVRGLLCRGCNSALGYAKDSPLILRSLANYLEYHNGNSTSS